MSNQTDQKEENKTLLTDTDNEIRDLVIARLSILSPDTLTEIQLAWLRSLKEVGSDSARASV